MPYNTLTKTFKLKKKKSLWEEYAAENVGGTIAL